MWTEFLAGPWKLRNVWPRFGVKKLTPEVRTAFVPK